jgi:hypothetical protein
MTAFVAGFVAGILAAALVVWLTLDDEFPEDPDPVKEDIDHA